MTFLQIFSHVIYDSLYGRDSTRKACWVVYVLRLILCRVSIWLKALRVTASVSLVLVSYLVSVVQMFSTCASPATLRMSKD